jgi:hypothetical protein
MALEGQPPWRPGNPDGYVLFQGDERTPGAETMHRDAGGTIVITSWTRLHAGGRDSEPDDYFWRYVGADVTRPERIRRIVKFARKHGWIGEEKI